MLRKKEVENELCDTFHIRNFEAAQKVKTTYFFKI